MRFFCCFFLVFVTYKICYNNVFFFYHFIYRFFVFSFCLCSILILILTVNNDVLKYIKNDPLKKELSVYKVKMFLKTIFYLIVFVIFNECAIFSFLEDKNIFLYLLNYSILLYFNVCIIFRLLIFLKKIDEIYKKHLTKDINEDLL